jgi:hypothetical protein
MKIRSSGLQRRVVRRQPSVSLKYIFFVCWVEEEPNKKPTEAGGKLAWSLLL